MSQVAAKKKLVLRDERVKVTAHFRQAGSVLAGTQRGTCEGFSIELSLHGDAPAQEIAGLVRMAHQMCFTESALAGEVALTATHFYNGGPLELD